MLKGTCIELVSSNRLQDRNYLREIAEPSSHEPLSLHETHRCTEYCCHQHLMLYLNKPGTEIYQHPCTAKCFDAGTASEHWLCEPTLPTKAPSSRHKLEANLRASEGTLATEVTASFRALCVSLDELTAALATAKLASLETAFTSPSDLIIRLILASGSTCMTTIPSTLHRSNLEAVQSVSHTNPEESLSVSLSTACCEVGSLSVWS